MPGLYIIGADHSYATKGRERLLEIYGEIEPDIVMTEINRKGIRSVNAAVRLLKTKLKGKIDDSDYRQLIDIFSQKIAYECRTNQKYAREHGIPHYHIDEPNAQSQAFNQILSKLEVLTDRMIEDPEFSHEFIDGLNDHVDPSTESVRENFDLFLELEGKPSYSLVLSTARDSFNRSEADDTYMAKRIRRHYDPDKSIACVVGFIHATECIFDSTLYSKVWNLSPTRRILI